MQLSKIILACGLEPQVDVSVHIDISSIEYDSRQVKPGSAFFALRGAHADGHDYIKEACKRGASALFYDRECHNPHVLDNGVTSQVLIPVKNSRLALSQASAAFYSNPAEELIIIGVTGTDGKSSVTSFLQQLLEAFSIPTGSISTVSIQTGKQSRENNLRQSTPEAPEIHRLLREMSTSGKKVAIIESTSHGLSKKTSRLASVRYDAGIFTNIDHEHLDFHGSFENYLSDKANLFRQLRPIHTQYLARARTKKRQDFNFSSSPIAILNKSDRQFAFLKTVAEKSKAKVKSFALLDTDKVEGLSSDETSIDIGASKIKALVNHSSFRLHIDGQSADAIIPIPCHFNIENILACTGILYYLFGIGIEEISNELGKIQAVQGRMLSITEGQDFDIIIDYAHSPGSFRKIFPALREFCRGRLIVLFGSAGERDIEKRPMQGKIAASYADIIILTEEDPRLEDSMKILNDIAKGAEGSNCIIRKIPNRRNAIEEALECAEAGDMVVMLGKGHEKSIITAEGSIPWNEEREVRAILDRRVNPRINQNPVYYPSQT